MSIITKITNFQKIILEAGELNLKYGHIAAPPTVIEEEITPDSIKRTFSAEELEADSQSEDDNKTDVDVDIAILDTGIDPKSSGSKCLQGFQRHRN